MIPGACAQMAASWVEESSDPKIVEVNISQPPKSVEIHNISTAYM